MTTETTTNTRTLRAYAIELLRFPRWHIEREVDFTGCSHDARYDPSVANCVECRFGTACRWLNRHGTPSIDDAPLDELTEAIENAARYLQASTQKRGDNNADVLTWIREARRFLRAGHQ